MNLSWKGAAFALGLAAALLGAPPAAAAMNGPKLRWDMSLWGKPRPPMAVAEALASQLRVKTGGNWRLNLHYGEALSKARENLDGLAIGAFEAAMFCNFYHPRKNPALMALSLPFLPMTNWEDGRRLREAVYAHPAVERELARWNARLYTSAFLPQYEFLGRGRPPLNLQGWKGLTVRAGGGLGQAMLRLGATPASSPATEVYTGVQQGTMDAAALPFPSATSRSAFMRWRNGSLAIWRRAPRTAPWRFPSPPKRPCPLGTGNCWRM